MTQEEFDKLEKYDQMYSNYCKERTCDECKILEIHQQTKKSCFLIFVDLLDTNQLSQA